jgi:uncharacterized protein (DUF1501 family)
MDDDRLRVSTRRYFFQESALRLASIALSTLSGNKLFAGETRQQLAFAPRAKHIIFLFMAGGPSQVDLLDYKPELNKFNGQNIPEELLKNERFAFIRGVPKLLGSPYEFKRHGKSGTYVSNLLPHLSSITDDIAVVRSVQTDQFNHAPAQIFMNTGSQLPGRPSMGAWLSYGIGTENANLPAFIVLISGQQNPEGGKSCWSSGFLPTTHQGVEFRSSGDPVLFLSNPKGISPEARRESLSALRNLNQAHLDQVGDPEVATRIASYEMAYRMQSSVPELMDISQETASTHQMYGTQPGQVSFANNCLLARRLVERGVRFVQLYHRGWDHHGTTSRDDLVSGLPRLCREADQPAAALVKDLKQRGLLESTLVVWGGEFGRTPVNEGRDGSQFLGRDHHPHAFAMWMAGGGIQPGVTVGQTDELGYRVAQDPVHVHDLHATILHQLGLDHTRLTYRYQGREFRLTDVSGNVVRKLIG